MRDKSLAFRRNAAILLCTVALGTSHAARARAEEDAAPPNGPAIERAEQRAAQAFQAYERKDYPAAVALYLEAYEASPSADMLYNIARIYDTKLGDRPLAMTFYRRYIADPGAIADRIKTANARLIELREAEIAVDSSAGQAATSGQPQPYGSSANDQAPPEPSWSSLRWAGVGVGAAGVVGVGVGALFGAKAMSGASTANDLCDGNLCSSERGVSAAKSASNDASLANVGFIAGGLLLATGTVLFIVGGDEEPEQSKLGSGLDLRASLAPAHAGLELSGTW
jgi:tetratricopeptide (TPR) repeat protein